MLKRILVANRFYVVLRFVALTGAFIIALTLRSVAHADDISDQNCRSAGGPDYYVEACTDAKAARVSLIRQWNRAVRVMRSKDEFLKDHPNSESEIGIGYYQTLLLSEQKWLSYRAAQCDADVYIDRMAQGSGPGAMYLRCLSRIDTFRADELKEFSDWVEGK